jgi:glyoxylase-like metal-dependent hydrolase (beta-lactamase superfamily II)
MNALELQLHSPLGEALPEPGRSLEVAAGVRWIRMSLPFALNHINLWLLRDVIDGREGWSVVDCCVSRDESKAQWEQVFDSELLGLPILRVIVTHMHPDHVGLADWLCKRWDARLWMSATDYNVARLGALGPTAFGGDATARHLASHGLNDAESVEQIRGRATYFSQLVPAMPGQYRRMADGDVLTIGGRPWTCISGYGHAPEHISLHCAELGLLIGGDMMLPRISTNISVFEVEPESDPLTQFLESIDRLKALPEDTLTLPSHGKPFTGLHARIGQLQDHHRERLADALTACRTRACSAADIVPVLFPRTLDMHQRTFAMGEAIAHLHALWYRGQLRRSQGEDGVYRFQAECVSPTAAPTHP